MAISREVPCKKNPAGSGADWVVTGAEAEKTVVSHQRVRILE
jgi:hypothetical protein